MEIPLPDMMRTWRERDFARGNPPFSERFLLKLWAFAAKRPRLYHVFASVAARWLERRGGSRGRLSRLPIAKAWIATRDLPAPQGRTFHSLYARAQKEKRA
jgi:L-lactate dehydrogenase complex protein LldF